MSASTKGGFAALDALAISLGQSLEARAAEARVESEKKAFTDAIVGAYGMTRRRLDGELN